MTNFGKVAYDAFSSRHRLKNAFVFSWEQLDKETQAAWEAAAKEVLRVYDEEIADTLAEEL